MRDYTDNVLRILCVVLVALVLAQMARSIARLNPLGEAAIPDLPTWPPPSSSATSNVAPMSADRALATSGSAGAPVPAEAGHPLAHPKGMPGLMPGGPRTPGIDGPNGPKPEIRARVDRITQSGLLGPVIRPPPMALLGIVGRDVLLRAPDGQSGLIREGGELGGVQLLKIGTNRVLVREGGQEKELLIFEGLGGASLLKK